MPVVLKSQQESELLKNDVATLMDLDSAQHTQDDESIVYDSLHTKEEEEEEHDTDDSLVKLDNSYCSEYSSKLDYPESDDDLDEEFYNIEQFLHKKYELIVPDQVIHNKDLFITKVHIEILLPFGNIRSFHATLKKKSQCGTVSNIIHQDVQSCAIHVTNNSIHQ